jgi:hypothetical protein
LQKFDIYPKEGEMFSIKCEAIERTEDNYVLYNDINEPSKEAFLSFNDVAAIIPGIRVVADTICFRLYLRNRPGFIDISAHAFVTEPKITFYLHDTDGHRNVTNRWAIEGIYVDPSELIAIVPSDGLVSFRK